jgi:hypothetical protein
MDIKIYLNKGEDDEFSEGEYLIALEDYKRMIDIFFYLITTMSEKKIKDDYWRYFTEMLAIKFVWSANTLTYIINGSPLKSDLSDISIHTYDFPSIYTLMRKQIENYSTFQYLYIRPRSKQTQEFHCLIYEIAGLESRQQYDAELPELKELKLNEARRIDEILIQLKANEVFLSLEDGEQKKILNDRRARLLGWKKIIEESDLVDNLFKQSWLLYSNFAHSEYASLIQLKGFINTPEDAPFKRNLVLNLAMVLISVFIKDFISLYKVIEDRYDSLPINDREVIEFFSGVGRKSVFNESK